MNIIFGKPTELEEKYTVLELDTIRIGSGGPERTAYCVIENIPLEEMPAVESLKDLHGSLMQEYRNRAWNRCETIIGQLTGKWGGEMDSFYIELANRVARLKTQTLDDTWNGVIEKSVN
jgi:hypothetical protein